MRKNKHLFSTISLKAGIMHLFFIFLIIIIANSSFSQATASKNTDDSKKDLRKTTEKAIKQSEGELQKIEEKIEEAKSKKATLQKAEKSKEESLKKLEKDLQVKNNESRKSNYGMIYTEDFVKNLETDLEETKNGIAESKAKLDEKTSELMLLSLRTRKRNPVDFLDDNEERLASLRSECEEELAKLKTNMKAYEKLSGQLDQMNEINSTVKEKNEKVQQQVAQVQNNLDSSIKDLSTLKKSRAKAETELSKLLESQKKIQSLIKKHRLQMETLKVPEKTTFTFSGEGSYPWPVSGKILRSYIPDKTVGTFNPGIDISAPEGSGVKSVAAGTVLFAGKLTGYGNVIIIEHNKDYCTLYSYLKEMHVKTGARVDQGTVIASSGVIESIDEPGVHFELRKDSESVNPGLWLNSNPK